MSARKSRHLLMQALVRSSALYGAHPQLADIDAELEELGRCSRLQPVRRQRLLQVIHASRAIDTCLSTILVANGKTNPTGIGGKARAVFGGMRLSDLTERIRQMMRIDKRQDGIYQEVDACLVQLSVIADQRHKLVHRMVEYAGSHLSVSNALTAKSLAAIEADVFSERDLRNMQIDCGSIFLRLLRVIAPDIHVEDGEVDALVRAPWRYKPRWRQYRLR